MDHISALLLETNLVKQAEATLKFKKKWLNQGYTHISNRLLRDTTVSPAARVVYILLMSRCFSKEFSFPGQSTLANETGVSERQIRRLLKELVESDWVKVKRRGLGKSNLYFLVKD
jgi:hypothetical protein